MASTTLSTPESLKLIQFIVAVPLLVFGLYMVGPWYVILPGQTAFGSIAIASLWAIKVPSALMVVAGVGTIYGAFKGNSTGLAKASIWFAMSMYVFLLTTRIIAVGFVPLIWILYVPLIGVTAVLALAVRTR